MSINIHERIMAEYRREHPTGEPTWLALIEAAGRAIDRIEKELDKVSVKADR